jgi:hypothetical protein
MKHSVAAWMLCFEKGRFDDGATVKTEEKRERARKTG